MVHSENLVVEVYNSLGAMAHTTRLSADQKQLDLSSLTNGIYIVKAYNGKEILSQKIIKQ